MLLHELKYGAYQGNQAGYQGLGYPLAHGSALHGYGRLDGFGAPAEGRVLYDGLGNPVGILPFIAALAPLAAKALTALPAIAGKAATLLPQITSAASALIPPSTAAAGAPAPSPEPQQATPIMPPTTLSPMPMIGPMSPTPGTTLPPPAAIETVSVPMRENDGRVVMVRRRLVRRGRRRRASTTQTTMIGQLPGQRRPQNLQGWIGWPTTWT
jgi:hypothetical protein